jgi:hypothetical protein
METDRTDTGNEDVENPSSTDRHPPPPPDRPGTDGYPSRADSRDGAAAANEAGTRPGEGQVGELSTAQEPQQTSGRDMSVGTEGETRGTPESGEDPGGGVGSGEWNDDAPPQEDQGGAPDTDQAPEGLGGSNHRRELLADGQNMPPDSTAPYGISVSADTSSRADLPGKPLERPDAAEPEAKVESRSTDLSILGREDVGDRLLVHSVPLREHLDPLGAAAWSNEIGDVVNERSADRIVAGESDKDSRFERLRKKGFEKGDDTLETVNKATNRAHDRLARQPPAGHVETRSGPDTSAAPHQGIDGGDALTAALMVGVLFDDVIRRVRKKATQRKGLDDAGNG